MNKISYTQFTLIICFLIIGCSQSASSKESIYISKDLYGSVKKIATTTKYDNHDYTQIKTDFFTLDKELIKSESKGKARSGKYSRTVVFEHSYDENLRLNNLITKEYIVDDKEPDVTDISFAYLDENTIKGDGVKKSYFNPREQTIDIELKKGLIKTKKRKETVQGLGVNDIPFEQVTITQQDFEYNDKHNIIRQETKFLEKEHAHRRAREIMRETIYEYVKYDSKGNWTEATVTTETTSSNPSVNKSNQFFLSREIEYY